MDLLTRSPVVAGDRTLRNRGMTPISAAIDFYAGSPDATNAPVTADRLSADLARIGIETVVVENEPAAAGRGGAVRSLIVRWDGDALERLKASLVASRRDVDASFARLGQRPRIAATAGDGARVVPVQSGGVELGAGERMLLDLLIEAVERVLADGARRRPMAEKPLLSRRERECLQWTAAGKTTWEIAAILDISQNTVDGYIATAAKKLAAVNRTQAVAEAIRRGIID
jgi:DNA-binding CsgD family transcriptional regulator